MVARRISGIQVDNVDSPGITDLPRLVNMPSRINDLNLVDRMNLDATPTDPTLSRLKEPSFDAVSFLKE